MDNTCLLIHCTARDKIETGVDMFHWWMEDDNISGQLSMDNLIGGKL